jgi:hypothetical protein
MGRLHPKSVRRQLRRLWWEQPVSWASHLAHLRYDPAHTVTVFGSRRSGTTWVQEMLSGADGTCPIFEPLAPGRVTRRLGCGPDPALAAGDSAPRLAAFLDSAMRGGSMTPWASKLTSASELIRADRFVVKHVQLNLAAGWVVATFPRSPSVAVVRHPCAVVQSMLSVDWRSTTAADLLSGASPTAVDQMVELVDGRTSQAALQAARWAVEVRALLRDTDPDHTHLVAYEQAVADPAGVLGSVMEATGLPRPADLMSRAGRPSQMAQRTSVTWKKGDPVTAWVERLPVDQRDEVLEVVARAGLVGFGPDPRPDVDALRDQHGAGRTPT